MKLYRVEFRYMNDVASVHVACAAIEKAEEYARKTLKKLAVELRNDKLLLMAIHILEDDLFVEGAEKKSPIVFKES